MTAIKTLKISSIVCLLFASSLAFPATLAHQGFAISSSNYDDGDNTFSGTAVYLRKTLSEDTLSLKLKGESIGITEDAPRNPIIGALPYAETENSLALGLDYIYYDSSITLSTNYGTVETSSMSGISLDVTQEYNNGANYLVLGFGNGWEDDSELGMHNQTRHLRLGSKFGLRPFWTLFTSAEFSSADGDLENFRAARRYSMPDRTSLPDSRTDRVIRINNIFDRGKRRYLNIDITFFKNNWAQSGKSVELSFQKLRTERFSLTTHLRMSNKSESAYYLDVITATLEPYYSDHQTHASQDLKEIGLIGEWRFKPREGKRFNNFKFTGGATFSEIEYGTADKVSNSGTLLYINFAGDF